MGVWNGIELDDLTLTDARLTLRPLTLADAPTMAQAMQDRSMHEFLPLPDPYGLADAEYFIQEISQRSRTEGTALECGIVETATGRLVGAAGLRLPRPRGIGAEIGYSIYASGRGNGYAARASDLLARWGFAHGLDRIQIRAAVTNLASIRSALNAGFRFEGVARAAIEVAAGNEAHPMDGAVFARLPDDPLGAVPHRFPALPPGGLSDGTVRLRVLEPSDAQAVLEQDSDALSRQWSFYAHELSRAEAQERCSQAALQWLVGAAARMAIIDEASGETAGSLSLRAAGPPGVGGVGYVVGPSWRGRGYTTRALRLLSTWALGDEQHGGGGFNRLELGAKVENLASVRAAASAGFTPDGLRVGRLRNSDGTYGDETRFALVRS